MQSLDDLPHFKIWPYLISFSFLFLKIFPRCYIPIFDGLVNTESETSRFVFIDLPLATLLHLLQGLLKLPHIVHSVIICLHNPRHLSWQCHNFKTITDLDNTFVIRDNFGNSTALMEQDENKSVCIWPIWQWFHFLRSTWWQKWRDQWKALMDL